MSAQALVLGSFQVPASANPAQRTVAVERDPLGRRHGADTDILLRCIAEAYRSYHSGPYDTQWAPERFGARLRLIGKLGSELSPRRRYVSLDLEDFE